MNVFVVVYLSASMMLRQAEELAEKYPNTIPVMLDAVSQEGHLDSLVKDHDLVIRYSLISSLTVGNILNVLFQSESSMLTKVSQL